MKQWTAEYLLQLYGEFRKPRAFKHQLGYPVRRSPALTIGWQAWVRVVIADGYAQAKPAIEAAYVQGSALTPAQERTLDCFIRSFEDELAARPFYPALDAQTFDFRGSFLPWVVVKSLFPEDMPETTIRRRIKEAKVLTIERQKTRLYRGSDVLALTDGLPRRKLRGNALLRNREQ
jgi:hypothetical protein